MPKQADPLGRVRAAGDDFLLAGAAARFRYLRPGLAVILVAVAAELLLGDLYHPPVWASPAVVLAVVAVLSVRDDRRRRTREPERRATPVTSQNVLFPT